MRSFTRVCRIYVTVLHYISEGAIALFFYYTNLHLMVIFNTYKCADWRKFLIFTDITKKKKTQRSAYSMNARSPMNPFSKAKEKLDFRSVSN